MAPWHRAIADVRKLAGYSLNPSHPRGRHKARVFRRVKFSDDQGRAYAVAPCREVGLLVLRYVPEAA
jgi:hypothetical protein